MQTRDFVAYTLQKPMPSLCHQTMIMLINCRPNVSQVRHTTTFEAPSAQWALFLKIHSHIILGILSCAILSRDILGRGMFIRDSDYRDTLEFTIVTHKIFFASFSPTRCRSRISDAATPYIQWTHA